MQDKADWNNQSCFLSQFLEDNKDLGDYKTSSEYFSKIRPQEEVVEISSEKTEYTISQNGTQDNSKIYKK